MTARVENPGGEVRVYEDRDGEVRVDVRLDRETVWLTQKQMSQLFGRERSVITKHVRNMFRKRELEAGGPNRHPGRPEHALPSVGAPRVHGVAPQQVVAQRGVSPMNERFHRIRGRTSGARLA
jgi:hypothetical protein